jgi:hypothetical protein
MGTAVEHSSTITSALLVCISLVVFCRTKLKDIVIYLCMRARCVCVSVSLFCSLTLCGDVYF